MRKTTVFVDSLPPWGTPAAESIFSLRFYSALPVRPREKHYKTPLKLKKVCFLALPRLRKVL